VKITAQSVLVLLIKTRRDHNRNVYCRGKNLTMAGKIWTAAQTFSAESGKESVITLKAPYRGILRGYRLAQTNGLLRGAAASLYTSNQETEPNSTLPAEKFRVLSVELAVGAAKIENHFSRISYANSDGTEEAPQRLLYLKIMPYGSGPKSFTFSATVETPIT
jgi:hypothetical protein